MANFKFYFVTLARRLSLNFRYMEKQITSAIASDKTKTFFSIKKLYRACIHYNNLFLEISVVDSSILCDQSLSFISLIVSHSPSVDYFQIVSSTTPPTIIAGLRTILEVTRSTSRKNVAAKISEKNGPVLAIGITTETLPRSSA